MNTRTLQRTAPAIVIDECSSWIERVLLRAARAVAEHRARKVRRAQLNLLAGLSTARLRDIGLDDPRVQEKVLGSTIVGRYEDLEDLRNLNLARR